MRKHEKILVFILCSISVNALILTGCDARPATAKETTVISSAEEASSEEHTAQSTETESTDEKIRTPADTEFADEEVSTDAEAAAAREEDALNLEILEQMTTLKEKGEFLEAIKATEGMNRNGDNAPKIIALRSEIIRGNKDYFETQLTAAFKVSAK